MVHKGLCLGQNSNRQMCSSRKYLLISLLKEQVVNFRGVGYL